MCTIQIYYSDIEQMSENYSLFKEIRSNKTDISSCIIEEIMKST